MGRAGRLVKTAVPWTSPDGLRIRRVRLARSAAGAMSESGFPAYDGEDYPGIYDGDEVAGVFVDRHLPGRRIYLLRRPRIPSVIIETHHALHRAEATRWAEPRMLEVFSNAVTRALVSFLTTSADAGATPVSRATAP